MGEPPVIRRYEPTDASALWDMLCPVFRAGETYAVDPGISREAALAMWTEASHGCFVLIDGGGLLGSFYLKRNQEGGGSHVCNCGFVTAPQAEGRGIARAMLGEALARARASGFRAMQFNFVVETNTRAIALWQSHGFETVGRLPGAFDHPTEGMVDALVMYRRLD